MMRTAKVLAVVIVWLFPLACHAQFQPVLQPNDLSPGDEYRLAFVTSQFRDATSSDIEDYNVFVQSVADAAPVVGDWGLTWKAIASTARVDARDNTGTNLENGLGVPIYRVDGVQLVENYLGLWMPQDNVSPVFFDVTEIGTHHTPLGGGSLGELGAYVWTGTEYFGALGPKPNPLGSGGPYVGWANNSNSGWINAASGGRAEMYPLYAISDVITAVPEPSGWQLYLLPVGLLVFTFRVRR